MDAVKFLKTVKRWSVSEPLKNAAPAILLSDEPESYVAEMERWAKEHPIKTRQSEFVKMFPNAEVDEYGVVEISPCSVDVVIDKFCRGKKCKECRRDYWSQEVE